MDYRSSFTVNAPLVDVQRFHSLSTSMGAITPPPVIVRIHSAPVKLNEGDEMDFTMWLGPLPVRWLARIEEVTPTSFADRQIRGPFTKWIHRHSFVAIDANTSEVRDHVEAELSTHPFWKLLGGFMWLNMPVLFTFRKFKTRWLLNKKRQSNKVGLQA